MTNPIHKMPEMKCPKCGRVLDGASPINSEYENPPKEGDITFCMECRTIMEFDKDFNLREMTPDELNNLPQEVIEWLLLGLMASYQLKSSRKSNEAS